MQVSLGFSECSLGLICGRASNTTQAKPQLCAAMLSWLGFITSVPPPTAVFKVKSVSFGAEMLAIVSLKN